MSHQSDPSFLDIYRPQRSWAKVISLQASVCPQGGGGVPGLVPGGVGGGEGCLQLIRGGVSNFFGGSEIFFFFFQFLFPPY